MRIVRFATPNQDTFHFQDQKISLSKLSQVKARSNVQHNQIKQTFDHNLNKVKPIESHIKWVPSNQQSSLVLNQVQGTLKLQSTLSPNKFTRRKIFQNSDNTKQNLEIPTFSQMPQIGMTNQQQTHYYSMINSPKQKVKNMKGSKISTSREFRSPFKTNEQNINFDSHYSHNTLNSNTNINVIEKSSLLQLTQLHIPRLQQKLHQHDEQLATIKKYLKNTQKLKNMGQHLKEYQQIQLLTQKQKQIQARKLLLSLQIQRVRNNQKMNALKFQQQADDTIQSLERQRVKRLNKIHKQNQILYQNLQNLSYRQSYDNEAQTYEFKNYNYKEQTPEYQFQGPITFPSKDQESERQIIMPNSDGFTSNYKSDGHFNKRKVYNNAGEMQLSPGLKKKMNEISSIGFSNNKTQSFSMQANTFREIVSPLDFQSQNNDMNVW